METLQSTLTYEPRELEFGTSGRRGKVVDLTQLEIYINARAELEYLQSLDPSAGGILRGEEFYLARDLRPSSAAFVADQQGRGEIAQTIVAALRDAGMRAVNLGCIPTPALACYALARGKASIMVTGSHIPFDRNGYKLYTSRGELSKEQESPINAAALQLRHRLYGQPWDLSAFDSRGFLRTFHHDLPAEQSAAAAEWIERFTHFFSGESLKGLRILAYQHSAVGRDLLAEILERLGAQVIAAGRSSSFVPIDTENIGAPLVATIQALADAATASHGTLDAVVSTDGDSDRPLILGVDPTSGRVQFFGGDLAGMVVAEFLEAGAVVVPVTSNDAIDRGKLAAVVAPKTRIGSPYVIAGMQEARAQGKQRVCGWEPNGGFLTGSDIQRTGGVLKPLLTRDAMLPILCVLFAAAKSRLSLVELFARLPKRFSKAALLSQFPRAKGTRVVSRLLAGPIEEFFTVANGFGPVERVDTTDGVRILFANGDVAHVRPSGNADELRIYAVADTQARADTIAALGIAEPDGILRRLERAAG